ncbi:MAG: MBOAT family O-acyltransferase, partial [Bacteroidota bacterium]
MLYNSIVFFFFFIIVSSLYFILAHRYRWVLLLVASCYFYMASVPVYILILFAVMCIDYIAGIFIENATGRKRLAFLISSIVANVGILAIFKYYNFFVDNFAHLLHNIGLNAHLPAISILLPIGLSFHTFQSMSYTIEVYRGNQKAEKHLGIYALYVMFYPQLVAGPIERPQNMLPQFREKKEFDYARVTNGLRLMVWGLFKKVVIADRLAVIVDMVYANPHRQNGPSLIIGTFFFAFQIYCDFSGYCDISIGAARVMDFRLMQNFNFPFRARNITDYWRRWHISLSTWFSDYVFSPFTTKYRHWGKWVIVSGLLLTFFISGLWHGAAWTFIIWGVLHGVAICYEYLTLKTRKRVFSAMPAWLSVCIGRSGTFIFLCFTWIFFRAKSIRDAIYIVKHTITDTPQQILFALHGGHTTTPYDADKLGFVIAIVLILLLESVHHWQNKVIVSTWFVKKPLLFRWAVYLGVLLC